MSTGRTNLRIRFAAATCFACLLIPVSADAGCFDWFRGRSSNQYTANYPAAAPYGVGYPQATGTSPVAVPTPPANPGVANSGVIQAQRPAYGAPVYITPGYTTVQTFQNPSVYTGLPVTGGVPITNAPITSAQRLPITSPTVTTNRLPLVNPNQVPIASTLRGNASGIPITSAPLPNSIYTSNYAANDVAPVTYNAPVPSATVMPAAPPPQQSSGCGLTRFFNSCLGRKTNYTTSYYQAPITYYRPLTTINPVTGTTVTMQQPCTSTVQLLQRTPSNNLTMQAVPPTPYPNACPTPAACTPGTFVPPSNIGQVSGQSIPGGYGVSPIPSTIPGGLSSPGTIAPPNTLPLTRGSANDPMSNASDAADAIPMEIPQLESGRPNLEADGGASAGNNTNGNADAANGGYADDLYPYGEPNSNGQGESNGGSPSTPSDSNSDPVDLNRPAIQLDPPVTHWQQRQNPATRFESKQQYTTSTPPSLYNPSSPNTAPLQGSASAAGAAPASPMLGDDNYSTLRPIGVPAERESTPLSPNLKQTNDRPALEAPPLPAPSNRAADPSALFRNSESTAAVRQPLTTRVTVPIREATTRNSVRQVAAWEDARRESAPPKPAPSRPAVKRDRGGWLPAR